MSAKHTISTSVHQTNKKTDRQTDRYRNRYITTDREKQRIRQRQTDRQKDANRQRDRYYEKDTKTNRKDRQKKNVHTDKSRQTKSRKKKTKVESHEGTHKHPHLVSLPFIDRGLLLECLPFLFQLLPVNKSKNSTNDQENYKKHQNQNPSQLASLCLRFCSPC